MTKKLTKVFVSVGPEDPRAEFCFVPEGEIVYEGPMVCASHCGCERSLAGSVTHKATSLVKVAEVELDADDVMRLALDLAEGTGFGCRTMLASLDFTLGHAEDFEVGTVLHPEFDFDADEWTYTPVREEVMS